MFGVKFSSSTSSSNWPPELRHRPSLRTTPRSPSTPIESCNTTRRWGIGVIRGHREQFGPLIEDYNGIVFVKHVKLPPILLS